MKYQTNQERSTLNRRERVKIAANVEGMTSDGGLILMDIFLQRALESTSGGLLFEFGTYKGRTAALLAQSTGESNWFHAVDPSNYLETKVLDSLTERYTWHKERSEGFCIEKLGSIVGEQEIAYTHHDASHFFDNVKSELAAVQHHMSNSGVIILDDFNDPYSQVRAAYYYLRYTTGFPFELILIGFNKAILIHQNRFDAVEEYILSDILDDLRSAGLTCKLYRTDINKYSRNFFIAPRLQSEDDRYGLSFFGDMFYKPSSDHFKTKS